MWSVIGYLKIPVYFLKEQIAITNRVNQFLLYFDVRRQLDYYFDVFKLSFFIRIDRKCVFVF